MMTIEEMRQYRKETGLSYEEISRRSGVPFGTIQKVFSGITKSPRHKTLEAIEKAFDDLPVSRSYVPTASAGTSGAARPTGMVMESPAVYGDNTSPSYPDQGHYTVDDYHRLTGDRRAELIDGVIYDMSSPSSVHQIISAQLHLLFARAIAAHNGDCEAFYAPIDVQLDEDDRTMVEPDLLIVCDPERVHKEGIFGAPDLIVEILSPSTRRKDMTLKMWKYSTAGVREYWIVDPDKLRVIVYLFAPELNMTIYTFHDKIPVGICDDKLQIDFDPIWKRIQRFY